MILFPSAKINLGLHVRRKRQDDYHEIESVMYPIPIYDVLEVIQADTVDIKVFGADIAGNLEDNLIYKAYALLKGRFTIPEFQFFLQKNIPMGAGLGGGSADGTFALRAINDIVGLGISKNEIADLSAELGSDCPFFSYDQAMLAKGRGEVLTPLDFSLNGWQLLIINPGIHVSTQEAYGGQTWPIRTLDFELSTIIQKPIEQWKDYLFNDFEHHIFDAHPALSTIKKDLYNQGAVYAAMSGSGSTMFGLFKNRIDFPVDKRWYSKWMSL